MDGGFTTISNRDRRELVRNTIEGAISVVVGKERQTVAQSSTVGGTLASFRGNYSHTIDEKGRVSLPSEFRRILERGNDSAVVLTNYISDGARCLEGFSVQAWSEFEEKLRQKSRFNPKLHKLENYYLSRAAECALDGSGRILIPAYLRVYAGMEREITFTSSIHGFRVWDTRVWNSIFQAAEEALMANPETFSDVDI